MIIFNQGRHGLLKISIYVVSIPSHVTCDGPNATLSLSSFLKSHMISKSSSDSKGIIHHFESWHVNLAERRMGPGMPRNGKKAEVRLWYAYISMRKHFMYISYGYPCLSRVHLWGTAMFLSKHCLSLIQCDWFPFQNTLNLVLFGALSSEARKTFVTF